MKILTLILVILCVSCSDTTNRNSFFSEDLKNELRINMKKSDIRKCYILKGTPGVIEGCDIKFVVWNSAAKKVYASSKPKCTWNLGLKGPAAINENILPQYNITEPYSDDILYELWFEEFSNVSNITAVNKRIRYEHWSGGTEKIFYKQ